jgi:cation diffusion facilitator CzcD-associated flavoprotein CzcO
MEITMSDVVSQHAGANSDTGQNGFDAIIVGAGIAGMYQLYRLRNLDLKARIFEAASGVGGTWYRNRYPGARADSPSYIYQ